MLLILYKKKKLNVTTTRFSNIVSTIRSTIYKQGKRNLIQNVQNGLGYEGIIEIYERETSDD